MTHPRGEDRWSGFYDEEVAAYHEPPKILSKEPDRKTPKVVGCIIGLVVLMLVFGLIGGDGVPIKVPVTVPTTVTTLPFGFTG